MTVKSSTLRYIPLVAAIAAFGVCSAAFAGDAPAPGAQRVAGYFCDSTADQIAFQQQMALGEPDVMAANTVNKAAGKQTCAPYLPVSAIPSGEKTVVADGVVYQLQGYVFLPEKVERWSGAHFGSLAARSARHDI